MDSEERDKQDAARAAYQQQFGLPAPETGKSALPRDWHRTRGHPKPLNTPMPHCDPAYDEFIRQKFVPRTTRDQGS